MSDSVELTPDLYRALIKKVRITPLERWTGSQSLNVLSLEEETVIGKKELQFILTTWGGLSLQGICFRMGDQYATLFREDLDSPHDNWILLENEILKVRKCFELLKQEEETRAERELREQRINVVRTVLGV
jgi:hypothetical protein